MNKWIRITTFAAIVGLMAMAPATAQAPATANDWRIVPGDRMGAISFTMSLDDVLKVLGPPTTTSSTTSSVSYFWEPHLLRIATKPGIPPQGPIEVVSTGWVGRAQLYRTDRGIAIGATEDAVKAAYQNEELTTTRPTDGIMLAYRRLGVSFAIVNNANLPPEVRGRVGIIFVYRPGDPNRSATDFLHFAPTLAPANNIAFRQALAYAIDRASVARSLVTLSPRVPVPATSIQHPKLPGYNPSVRGHVFDPEKAKVLFAQSGWTGPITILVGPQGNAFARVLAESVAQSIREVLEATVVLRPAEDFATLLRTFRQGAAPIAIFAWGSEVQDFGYPSFALGMAHEYFLTETDIKDLVDRRDPHAVEQLLLDRALLVPIVHY